MAETIERLYKLTVDGAQAARQLNEIAKSTESMDKRFEAAVGSIKKFAAALGVGAAIGGAVAGIKSVIESFDQLSKDAQKVGIAAEDLQRLRFAADMAGVGADELNTAIAKLSVNMGMLGVKGNEVGDALAKIGVKSGDTTSEALEKIADQFAKMPDLMARTALAIKIFGKAGADMIPLLSGGAEAFRELTKEADKFGGVISQGVLNSAENFNDNLSRLERTAHGAGAQLTAGMLPALQTISQAFVDATTTGDGFVSTGAKLGEMLLNITGIALKLGATFEAAGILIGAMGDVLADKANGFEILKAAKTRVDELGEATNRTLAKMRTDFQTFTGNVNESNEALEKGRKAREAAAAAAAKLAEQERRAAEAIKEHKKAEEDWWKERIRLQGALDSAQKASDDALTERNGDLTSQQRAIMDVDAAAKKHLDTIEEEGARLQYLIDLTDEESDAYKNSSEALHAYARAQLALGEASGKTSTKIAKQSDEVAILDRGFEGFFENLAQGTGDASDLFHRAVESIIADLLKLWAKKYIIDAITRFGMGGSGGSVTITEPAVPSGNIPSASTSVSPLVFPTALSGVSVAEPVALQRASLGALGVQSQASPMNVTVNNYTDTTVTTRQTGPQDLEIIIERTRAAIASDVSRGGTMVSRSIEQAYGVGRGAAAQF
jgi:hypothetical protein